MQRHHIVGFGVGSFLTTVGLSYWLARPSDPASVVQVPQDAASVVAGDDGPVAAASSSADAAAPCADAKVCNAENAKLCPDYFKAGVGLAPVADWSARASAAGYSTGSPKLAGQDCLEAHRAERSPGCVELTDCRSELNARVRFDCAAFGGLCAGVTPIPGEEPFFDCYRAAVASGQIPATSACATSLAAHAASRPR